ncbi:proton-conducting transporter membrane subunit [Actinopolymorpha pittospori]|uniref:Formate hydrogenlyase subunit 3/multisubunit Na+/H+ antiporter MnhD subunit n=1 Tax=Actinopolymorpha pittospori TaxID=648752 RepID=A0A927MVB6_9ACTN|nr:proton-conducting transporter membrane subunit [Actinopolymorpha pittospori]MBE1603972.1 formate hydrogenlyase subunit 3/multisubunit Na+/H+ antiporter MnhD subunit [Actinopolymorpha pittospori]
MSLAGLSFTLSLAAAALAAVTALVSYDRIRPAVVGTCTAISGALAAVAGVAALTGQAFSATLPNLLPLFGVRLELDPLGGLFVAVTGGVAITAGIYGIGYSGQGLAGRGVQALVPLFVAAMLLVPAAASVSTFLVCWELMALTSLLLVVAEHRRRTAVGEAGLWYAVMTHLGMVAILIGLMLFAARAHGDEFAALRSVADQLSPAAAGTVFVATLIGFASKAGILPLHAWLPRAHPEAPSHVSALMSAAMVNLGVYGILRVGFDLLGGGPRWWWLLVLGLGAISALYGILHAAMSADLKRLLGHSTTENLGLILVGVGAAGVFVSAGARVLAGLALTAALLHVVNHAAFKALLFLSAGSVLHATGSRDLDALGGLRTPMPVTTAMFGLGALAASALPPGNAFVSEWLLLQSLIHGLPASGAATAITMPVAVAAVALTAGVAGATFVKAFGVGFLARARSAAAASARESPVTMLTGMGLAGLACVGLALAPTVVVPVLTGAVGVAEPTLDHSAVQGAVIMRLVGVAGALSPLFLAILVLVGMVVVLAGLRVAAVRRGSRMRGVRREVRLWDCGAGPLSPRTQYTATSFVEPLQRVFDDVLEPESNVDVTHLQESRYLVDRIEYHRRVPDRIERAIYDPVLAFARGWGRVGRRLATGSVHRYLGYGFSAVIGLFVLLAVTR